MNQTKINRKEAKIRTKLGRSGKERNERERERRMKRSTNANIKIDQIDQF